QALFKTHQLTPRCLRIDSTPSDAHSAYRTELGILHQAVRTLTRTASSLGQKITSHVRATKRALARWGQSSKAKPNQRKVQGKKVLKKVAQLATDTLAQSRQAMEQLLRTAPTQLKEKFRAQIEV